VRYVRYVRKGSKHYLLSNWKHCNTAGSRTFLTTETVRKGDKWQIARFAGQEGPVARLAERLRT
jgi:hypothetical protein